MPFERLTVRRVVDVDTGDNYVGLAGFGEG